MVDASSRVPPVSDITTLVVLWFLLMILHHLVIFYQDDETFSELINDSQKGHVAVKMLTLQDGFLFCGPQLCVLRRKYFWPSNALGHVSLFASVTLVKLLKVAILM